MKRREASASWKWPKFDFPKRKRRSLEYEETKEIKKEVTPPPPTPDPEPEPQPEPLEGADEKSAEEKREDSPRLDSTFLRETLRRRQLEDCVPETPKKEKKSDYSFVLEESPGQTLPVEAEIEDVAFEDEVAVEDESTSRLATSPSSSRIPQPSASSQRRLGAVSSLLAARLQASRSSKHVSSVDGPDLAPHLISLSAAHLSRHEIRCQCTRDTSSAKCYDGWCALHDTREKKAVCGLVKIHTRTAFGCMLVDPDEEDGCRVVEGEPWKVSLFSLSTLQVHCLCRHEDYCNVDLSDRVDAVDGTLAPQGTTAEATTATTLRVPAVEEKDVRTVQRVTSVDWPEPELLLGDDERSIDDDDDYTIYATTDDYEDNELPEAPPSLPAPRTPFHLPISPRLVEEPLNLRPAGAAPPLPTAAPTPPPRATAGWSLSPPPQSTTSRSTTTTRRPPSTASQALTSRPRPPLIVQEGDEEEEEEAEEGEKESAERDEDYVPPDFFPPEPSTIPRPRPTTVTTRATTRPSSTSTSRSTSTTRIWTPSTTPPSARLSSQRVFTPSTRPSTITTQASSRGPFREVSTEKPRSSSRPKEQSKGAPVKPDDGNCHPGYSKQLSLPRPSSHSSSAMAYSYYERDFFESPYLPSLPPPSYDFYSADLTSATSVYPYRTYETRRDWPTTAVLPPPLPAVETTTPVVVPVTTTTTSEPKSFNCSSCPKQYCRRSTLRAHMREHFGPRPFNCQICGKSFSQAANLTAHKRVHTGQKPYSCDLCLMKFTQSGNLHRHMKTHKQASSQRR